MDKIETLNSFLMANKLPGKCTGAAIKGCSIIFDIEIYNKFRLNKFTSLTKELMLVLKSLSMPDITFDLQKGILQLETVIDTLPSPDLLDRLNQIPIDRHRMLLNLGISRKGEILSTD